MHIKKIIIIFAVNFKIMSRVKKIRLGKVFLNAKKVSYENHPIIKSLIKKEIDIIGDYKKLVKIK